MMSGYGNLRAYEADSLRAYQVLSFSLRLTIRRGATANETAVQPKHNEMETIMMHNQRKQRLKSSVIFSSFLCLLAVLFFSTDRLSAAAIGGSATVADVAALYEAKCASCHGKDGRSSSFAKKNGSPDFTDPKWQKSRTDAQLNAAITNGKGKYMQAWKTSFSTAEIEALVKQVRSYAGKG
jgi:mono/diheme cytochrome c family protein